MEQIGKCWQILNFVSVFWSFTCNLQFTCTCTTFPHIYNNVCSAYNQFHDSLRCSWITILPILWIWSWWIWLHGHFPTLITFRKLNPALYFTITMTIYNQIRTPVSLLWLKGLCIVILILLKIGTLQHFLKFSTLEECVHFLASKPQCVINDWESTWTYHPKAL